MEDADEIVVASQRDTRRNAGGKFATVAVGAMAGGAAVEKDIPAGRLRCAWEWLSGGPCA